MSTKVLTLSLGLIGAVVVGIGALVGILDLATTSQKEASEAIKKANENYSSQKEKLDELNNTLETTKERIEELSKQDSLTIIE